MEETIELLVKVKISYPDKSRRNDAIKESKRLVTGSKSYGAVCVIPKSAKMNKPSNPQH
jgi:hypothetical protein